MAMNGLFENFARAYASQNGYQLAETFSPVAPSNDPHKLHSIFANTNAHSVKADVRHFIKTNTQQRKSLGKDELSGWIEVYTSYWKAIGEILAGEKGKGSWTKVYEAWKDLTSTLIRGYNNFGFEAWTIPTLYLVGKYLRLFAIKSDDEKNSQTSDPRPMASLMQEDPIPNIDKQAQLRDCEQHLKRIFTLCLNDRAPLEESRKWGIYFIINLLFKTYFKLNSASLSRTILKTLAVYQQKGDMPPLEAFPKSQRVTFKYYEGVLHFLEENYIEAEKHLNEAWQLCHKDATTQIERILIYLIPCRLLTSHKLPTKALLDRFPRLSLLFFALSRCIKHGELHNLDLVLQKNEQHYVNLRIYLTLERGRDIALRNLLRKVFLAGGFSEPKEGEDPTPVRRTRVPVVEFEAAINMESGGQFIEADEVECLLANAIYKEYMKGYIARERGIVVLSKKGAFPGTGV